MTYSVSSGPENKQKVIAYINMLSCHDYPFKTLIIYENF